MKQIHSKTRLRRAASSTKDASSRSSNYIACYVSAMKVLRETEKAELDAIRATTERLLSKETC